MRRWSVCVCVCVIFMMMMMSSASQHRLVSSYLRRNNKNISEEWMFCSREPDQQLLLISLPSLSVTCWSWLDEVQRGHTLQVVTNAVSWTDGLFFGIWFIKEHPSTHLSGSWGQKKEMKWFQLAIKTSYFTLTAELSRNTDYGRFLHHFLTFSEHDATGMTFFRQRNQVKTIFVCTRVQCQCHNRWFCKTCNISR